MQLDELIAREGPAILDQAVAAMHRRREGHYAAMSEEVLRARLHTLLELTGNSVRTRTLGPLLEYVRRLAEDRYHSGFRLGELQVALNVLEEAIWERIVLLVPPEDMAVSLALYTTALGQAKDCLARTYVTLASRSHAPALNEPALFGGLPG